MTRDLIHINVQALNWTMGEHAFFYLKLKELGNVLVNWGDGHTNKYPIKKDWTYVEHYYLSKYKKDRTRFLIAIESEKEGMIIGFKNYSIDMHTEDFDVSGCKNLKELSATFMSRLDVSTNTELEILDISSVMFDSIDLSENVNLVSLDCSGSKIKELNISKCNNLKEVNCSFCHDLMKVAISNNSILNKFMYEDSPIKDKYLCFIKEAVLRNGGTIY